METVDTVESVESVESVAAQTASICVSVRAVLERTRAAGPQDAGAIEEVRGAILAVGRAAQALEGMLLALVGEGDRLGAARGGIGPFLATALEMTEGRARALAHDARLLAKVPDLTAPLCSGAIGRDAARALARTVKAVRATRLDPGAETARTLALTREHGARAGLEHARALEEHTDPGSIHRRHAQQRERSHARLTVTDGQMHRCEILLDPARGAILHAAIELQVAEMIRARQFDHTPIVPADVRTTEQMNAEALTRLAQVFLDAPPRARAAHFSLPALAVTLEHPPPTTPHPAMQNPAAVQNPAAPTTTDPAPARPPVQNPAAPVDIPAGCARTLYGALIPAALLPEHGNPRRRELHTNAHTTTLDAVPVDHDPTSRLATARQRHYLAWRDRHCTYPGCDRPITYALHAHHTIPHAQGGPTTVENLQLYCSQHHTTIHHQP